jgi:A/G-specific adenine glycosylase
MKRGGAKILENRKKIVSSFLIDFYYSRGKKYPWRENRNPYRVYLSEILLQRTRADQVVPVFNRIISSCPDVYTLYMKFDELVPGMLSLGRMIRLKYFREGLEYIIKNYSGEIPSEKELLLKIPGVGEYIAAAIRVFGYGLPDVIIDTNVVRVLSRFHGLQPCSELRRKKYFIELAASYLPANNYVEYSYGLLDFAASVCKADRPHCDICDINFICEYSAKK